MDEASYNPFLEGSKEVPADEVVATREALVKEAAMARSRASDIKEKAYEARAQKEAALRAEEKRLEAQVAATRAHLIKTVSSIPKASQGNSVRPEPPKAYETESVLTGIFDGSQPNSAIGISSLVADFAFAALAVATAFLILKDMSTY